MLTRQRVKAGLLTRAVVKQTRSVGGSLVVGCEKIITIVACIGCSIAVEAVAKDIPVSTIRCAPQYLPRNKSFCDAANLSTGHLTIYTQAQMLAGVCLTHV